MMHEWGKSASALVAGKPANEVGQSTEESVEPRAGTKGNADQQNTRRAQNREGVPTARDRIRGVARERKKEKFTSLFHHISIDVLEEAFYELRQNAAPGTDGLTWRGYEADLAHAQQSGKVHRIAYVHPALPAAQLTEVAGTPYD
jgi:RNA-directed DNA polymerase